MKVVRNIITGRLVFRQCPDFKDGNGIISASGFLGIPKEELEEVEVTEEEWEAECAMLTAESPLSLSEVADISRDNPQRAAYKASQLYGLTHEQLDNYVDGLSTMADYKEAFRRAVHVILYLVKQTKLDE